MPPEQLRDHLRAAAAQARKGRQASCTEVVRGAAACDAAALDVCHAPPPNATQQHNLTSNRRPSSARALLAVVCGQHSDAWGSSTRSTRSTVRRETACGSALSTCHTAGCARAHPTAPLRHCRAHARRPTRSACTPTHRRLQAEHGRGGLALAHGIRLQQALALCGIMAAAVAGSSSSAAHESILCGGCACLHTHILTTAHSKQASKQAAPTTHTHTHTPPRAPSCSP
jgi:hypothetical protein